MGMFKDLEESTDCLYRAGKVLDDIQTSALTTKELSYLNRILKNILKTAKSMNIRWEIIALNEVGKLKEGVK